MLTAYDFPTAQLLDEAGIPLLLVGDSLGQVMLGYETTVRVTMAEMLHHTKAVVRGTKRALVVGDMPFLSYATPEEALDNAGRSCARPAPRRSRSRAACARARIDRGARQGRHPGHGPHRLTPQAINAIGKVRVQGKTRDQARALLADALAVQEAGAFAIVLELVPEQLAAAITERLRIPTIGIGAGAGCSGQVQVITDLLGLGDLHPEARPAVRGPARRRSSTAAARLRGRRRGRHVPGPERDRPDGRRRPRRGPRPRRLRPRRPARSRSAASRSTATSEHRAGPLDPRSSAPAPSCAPRCADAPRPVGLVPTMGWLHDGHRALMQRARADDATTVVTIFVNPRQFNDAADFTQVPAQRGARPRDLRGGGRRPRLRAATSTEVYPPGFDTTVTVGAVARPLEGAARPGHFDGVATVVAILFDLVGAEHAYFGQKDAQQVMVIRRMARDLAIADRGHRLPDRPRARRPGAVVAERPPQPGRAGRGAGPPPRAARGARRAGRRASGRPTPCATTMRGDARRPSRSPTSTTSRSPTPTTLAELDRVDGPALLSLAVRFGTTRLIDNEPLEDPARPLNGRLALADSRPTTSRRR